MFQPTTATSTPFAGFQTNTAASNAQQQPATSSAVQTTPFTGLGGIDMSATQQKVPEGKVEATKVKETQVPSQVIQFVEEFKTYIKNQKTISSEITRTSDRKLKSVTDEIQRMNCVMQESSNNIDNSRSAIKHLRNETAKVIENADMAQRTHETPSGLQFENLMPQLYFRELIQKYENDLLNLKHQVELTEKHLQSLANPQNFTPHDLKRGLQQIHESFIALAGRLQEAHTKVETQKTQYLELRKFILRDTTNVFEVEQESTDKKLTSRIQYGPNAFSSNANGAHNLLSLAAFQRGSQQHQQQQQQQQPFSLNPQPAAQQNLFGSSAPSSSFNFSFNK
jgi:nucleoporin p58/p45